MKICTSCGSVVSPGNERCPKCGTPANGTQNKITGTTLADKYLIEELLGSGGMCDVYRARHIAMDKEVAIKILKPELAADPRVAGRFEQEARASSRVRHPHAINVTDYGVGENNIPFLVMELIEGHTVRELLRENGPMPVERVAYIIRQVCSALEAAHSVGVIHRDIKPDNIIISEYDGRDWVEVVDFGVAKIQEDVNRRSLLTGANFIIGTPRYMSPEQCEEKPVDARSDIYSLGVVVYEMLTGVAPFDAQSSTRLFMAHIAEPPPPISALRPDLNPKISTAVLRALEKDPDRRPQSAMEFSKEFEEAAGIESFRTTEGKSSASLSRISVPLDESPYSYEALRGPEELEEETLVKPRNGTAHSRMKPAGASGNLISDDSYSTLPDITRDQEREYSDTLPDITSAENKSGKHIPVAARDSLPVSGRKQKKKLVLIAGLFLLSVAIGFIAFMLFGNRPASSSSTSDKTAIEQPAPEASPDAGTSQSNTNTAAANTNASAEEAAAPAAEQANPPGEPTEETTRVDTGEVQKQVSEVISGWISSFESRNLNAHMQYYAPTLHTYFLKSNVDRRVARHEVANALSRYSNLSISAAPIEVRVDSTGKRAIATYNKSWNFEGARNWSGSTLERVWLARAGDRWVITGVKDLR